MQEPQCLVFGPFRLDLRDERLWRGHEATPLSPKTFEILCCLVSNSNFGFARGTGLPIDA